MRNGYFLGARLSPHPIGPRDFHADRQEFGSNATEVEDHVIDPYLLAIANHASGKTSIDSDSPSSPNTSEKQRPTRKDYRMRSVRSYRYMRESSRRETARRHIRPKTHPRPSKYDKPNRNLRDRPKTEGGG